MVARRILAGWAMPMRNKRPKVTLVERLETGQKLIEQYDSPIYPFFGIRMCDVDRVKAWFKENANYGIHQITPFGMPFLLEQGTPMKVECYSHKEVGWARDLLESQGIKTFLSDIPFVRNIMIQRDILSHHNGNFFPVEANVPLKYVAIDVETDDRTAIQFGKNMILSIAVVNMQTGEQFQLLLNKQKTNEKEILTRLSQLLWNFDVVVAWNAEFDRQVIVERCRMLKVRFDWRQIPFVDAMKFYRFIYNRASNERLIQVVERHLIKKGCPIKYRTVARYYELWERDPEDFCEANMNHAMWLYYLESGYKDENVDIEGLTLVNIMQGLADRAGVLVQDIKSKGVFNDVVALRQLRDKYVLGVRRYKDGTDYKKKKEFPGAHVFEPKAGRYSNAFVADLKSLYNRIAQVFLLSPEIMFRYIADHKIYFKGKRVRVDDINKYDKDEIGELTEQFFKEEIHRYLEYATKYTNDNGNFFLEGLQRAEELREKYRSLMMQYEKGSNQYEIYYKEQYFYKQQLLIFYGMAGSPSARFYYKIVAALITEIGRKIILAIESLANMYNFTVVGGDTDSVFLDAPEDRTPEQFIEDTMRFLKQFVDGYSLTPKYPIEIKIDATLKCLVHTDKKKRYYYRELDGNVESKGLQEDRIDGFLFLKEMQHDIKDLVTDFVSVEEIHKYLGERMHELSHDEEGTRDKLIITQGVHRRIEDYKSQTPHVLIAKRLVEEGHHIAKGDRVHYVCVAASKKTQYYEPVYEEDKVPDADQSAREWYWNNRIFGQVMALLSPCYDVKAFKDLKKFRSKNVIVLDEFT